MNLDQVSLDDKCDQADGELRSRPGALLILVPEGRLRGLVERQRCADATRRQQYGHGVAGEASAEAAAVIVL